MGVSLERVQNKFACIIGELCNEPLVLSQFAVWVDLRIAEYKTNGTISLDCSGTSPNPPWMKGVKNRPQRLGSNSMDTGQRNPHRHDGYSPNPTSSPISNQYYNDRTQPSESSRYEHTSTSQSPVSSRLSPDIVAVKQEPNTNQSTCALRRKRHSDAGDAMHSDYFSPMKSHRLNEDTSSLSEPIQESPSNQSLMSIINTENDSVSLEPIGDSFPGDEDMERLRPELDLTSENNSFDTQLPSTSSDQSAWPSQFNQSAPSTSSQPGTDVEVGDVYEVEEITKKGNSVQTKQTYPAVDLPICPVSGNNSHSVYNDTKHSVLMRKKRIINIDQKSSTTMKHLVAALGQIENWLREEPRSDYRHVEDIPPVELDTYLTDFFTNSKRANGQEFGVTYFARIRTSMERHLREHNYPYSIVKSAAFFNSQQAYKAKMRYLTHHWMNKPPE